MSPTMLPCGAGAVLVDCADLAEAVAVAARLRRCPQAVDVVPAASSVLVSCAEPSALVTLRAQVAAALAAPVEHGVHVKCAVHVKRAVHVEHGAPAVGPEVTLEVRYDGPDLAPVAAELGVGVDELVRRHTGACWRAAFGGFAPGFCYLVDERELGVEAAEEFLVSGQPPPLPEVACLPTPRAAVPAGSVALAGRYSGVYPGVSPGGWRLIGSTDAVLWAPDRDTPALIRPGDRVRFRQVAP